MIFITTIEITNMFKDQIILSFLR